MLEPPHPPNPLTSTVWNADERSLPHSKAKTTEMNLHTHLKKQQNKGSLLVQRKMRKQLALLESCVGLGPVPSEDVPLRGGIRPRAGLHGINLRKGRYLFLNCHRMEDIRNTASVWLESAQCRPYWLGFGVGCSRKQINAEIRPRFTQHL